MLTKYFNKIKYESFHRQLNQYHFKKIDRCNEQIKTFYHPHFQKGDFKSLKLITREGTGVENDDFEFESDDDRDDLLDAQFLATDNQDTQNSTP